MVDARRLSRSKMVPTRRDSCSRRFMAISVGPDPFVGRLKLRVEDDYLRLPYPITRELFYVTRDGVAGTVAA